MLHGARIQAWGSFTMVDFLREQKPSKVKHNEKAEMFLCRYIKQGLQGQINRTSMVYTSPDHYEPCDAKP